MKEPENVLCNLCGHTCVLSEGGGDWKEHGGLIKQEVLGGCASTPGNGVGALDDTIAYGFSLCEFCLDWLFGQFVIPVALREYTGIADLSLQEATWRPAAERVACDDWRGMKDIFAAEAEKRAQARGRK